MSYLHFVVVGAFMLSIWFVRPVGGQAEQIATKHFQVYPIGQVRKEEGRTMIILDKKFQPGLLGLDGFSHVYVLYWFDVNDTPQKRSTLQVNPRGNKKNPLSGVFATRAPVRPNLIALSLCKVLSVQENVIDIDRIDAFANTPVLDLKPYIPSIDAAEASLPEWVNRK